MQDLVTDLMEEALTAMVLQFGYRGVKNGNPIVWAGGLSVLEAAFIALGWDDPHYLPEEGYTCEVLGCMEEPKSGTHWGGHYLHLCAHHLHLHANIQGTACPSVKQWVIDREAWENPSTGVLDK